MMQRTPTTLPTPRRRASAYIVVLGTATAITVIGLAALMAIRVEARSASGATDFTKAMFYAQSAIETGVYLTESNSEWRTTYANGAWQENKTIGAGSYSLQGIDPDDGDLADSNADSLQLIGTGFQGDSKYSLRVDLEPVGTAYTCLEVPVHAGDIVTFDGATVAAGGPISANNTMDAKNSVISVNVESVGAITGGLYLGLQTTPISKRTMPDPATVFDYYIDPDVGTAIPRSDKIENVTLSPTSNPYGELNENGIYVMDCDGQDLEIKNSQIIGTIVALNANHVRIKESISWVPAVANLPALLVQGKVELLYGDLLFLLDLTMHTSQIDGLIYATDTIKVDGTVNLDGVLISDVDIDIKSTFTPTYDSTYLSDPPPGFFGPGTEMQVVQGSWRRLVD